MEEKEFIIKDKNKLFSIKDERILSFIRPKKHGKRSWNFKISNTFNYKDNNAYHRDVILKCNSSIIYRSGSFLQDLKQR